MTWGVMVNPEMLIACNVFVCVLVIVLGSFQRRYLDRFSIVATALMCMNGVGAVVLYSGTDLFPAATFGTAILLLIHGAVVHFPLTEYTSDQMLHSCPAFRCRCVCNHETWVLVAATAGLVSVCRM